MAVILSDRVKAVVSAGTTTLPAPAPAADDQMEQREAAFLAAPTYPNAGGLVKCDYCTRLAGYQCTKGHQPDGIALLRECGDFIQGLGK